MSRAINIEFEACASDHGRTDIKMLPILDQRKMDSLLREELQKDGWKKETDGSLTKDDGTAKVTLPADSNSVSIEVSAKEKSVARSDSDYNAETNQKIVEQARARKEEQMKEKIASQITATEAKITEELDAAVRRVYEEALKEKAASMGNIESIVRGQDAQGRAEVTIKVLV